MLVSVRGHACGLRVIGELGGGGGVAGGDVQSAKLKLWYVFSQPWSLWPRVADLCGEIFAWCSAFDIADLSIGSASSSVTASGVVKKCDDGLVSWGEYSSIRVLTVAKL